MEPKVSLPNSQVPAICPYPELPQSISYPTYYFLEINLFIIPPSTPGSPQRCPSFRQPHQNHVHAPSQIHVTCPIQFIILDFITHTILGEECRSLSSSLCSFLHSPVTSSVLGPNIQLWIMGGLVTKHIKTSINNSKLQNQLYG